MKSNFSKRIFAILLTVAMILTLVPTAFAFDDVEEGKYYSEAVDWAVEFGITNGISATEFGPNNSCTRGQVVTFIWRAYGQPEPTKTEHSFTDVSEEAFYYKAMLWAVENGITNGTSDTTFAPGATCTRAQVVTFLWRAAGEPEPTVTEHSFEDVAESAFYYKAMLWAVENGITKGITETTFVPGGDCTRGQVVTFLKRTLAPELPDLAGKTIILHTNDTHGALLGFAQAAGLKAKYEAAGAKVILVDAGDFSQGTPYVATNKGAAAVTMLNAAGYEYVTLGNHEFDFGFDQLKSNLEKAEFEVLCADIMLRADNSQAFTPYAVKEIDGVKIGFFGMETPETYTKVHPAHVQDVYFPQGEELYAAAKDAVDALKAEGVDLVIGIVHLGVDGESEPNRSTDLYKNVEGIDFLIDGHSHTVMTAGPDGEPIQSTGTKASKTSLMNVGLVQIDNATKTIEKNELIPVNNLTPIDKDVAAVAQGIMDDVDAEYGAPFATSEVELNGDKAPGNRTMETNLGDLIADALLWSVLKDMDAETLGVPETNVLAITNGGGIREWIHKGNVSKNDVNTVLPFGNTVAVVYVKGAELLEALEASTYCTPDKIGGFPQISGMKITIDTGKEFDQGEQYPDSTYYAPASIKRVTIDEINGQPFDPEATYAVVTNNFCSAGGDTYYAFKAASSQFDTGIPMDEALIDYIKEELDGVIGEDYAEPQGRITILEPVAPISVETTFPSATKADIDKYGDVHFSISSADLAAAGFEYADLVKLSFLDQEVIVPIIPQYRYVGAKAVGLVMWEDGTKPAEVEVFNGSFAATYGLADVVRDGSEYTVTPREGVEFPVPVTITMYEKQGYADTYMIFDLTRSNDREDYRGTVEPYPALTDEEFANFRKITTTGMGDGALYRASSPINPSIGRNTYADAAAAAAGVKSFVNLADSAASAAKYAGYAESYYSNQNICFLNLGVDFTTELNREGLKTAMEFIAAEDSAAPFLVHCNEGQDRAGFVSALLECLMGASYDEVVADYMVTFYNYYGVQPGTEQYKQISNNIVKNLSTAFGIQMSELAAADLAAEAEAYFKELDVSDETIAAVKAKLGAAVEPEGYRVLPDGGNMLKFGHIDLDVPVAEFLEDFALGDIVTVTVNGFTFDAPVVTNYDDVNTGEYLIRCASGKQVTTLAINYGQIGVAAGIIVKGEDGAPTNYVLAEGVEFPMYATITLKEAGGYADELAIRKLTRTNNREDYPDLTDAEFANFRAVGTAGIGENVLYRSSSPISDEIGRNTYADAAAEAAGIKTFVNLADTQADAEAFAGYGESYYATQSVKFLGLPVAFTTDEFKAGLAEGYRFIIANEAPYLVHCLEGKDRTGLTIAVVEALMGASLEEIQADYLKTYENYFDVKEGVQQPLTDAQKTVLIGIITKNLGIIFDVEDMATADLAAEAEAYLKEIGLDEAEIANLKAKLAGTPEPPAEDVYELTDTLAEGDEVIIVLDAQSKAVSTTANGNKLDPKDVTIEDDVITSDVEGIVFTVELDGENLLFVADEKYLTSGATGNSLAMSDKNDYSLWTAEATEGGFFLKNANAKYNGGDQYLEFYQDKFTVYGKKDTADPAIYLVNFYAKPGCAHDWVSGTVDPADCTHQEITHYTCSICSAEKTEVTAPALGHSWGDWTVDPAPTCTAKGSQSRTCSVCSEVETEEIPALGHKDENEDGKCDECGEDMPAAGAYSVAESAEAGDQIVIVYTVGEKFYALANDTTISNALVPVEVTFTDGNLDTVDDIAVWTLEAGVTEGSFLLKDKDGKYISYGGSGTGISLAATGADWLLTFGEGSSRVTPSAVATRCLFIRDNSGLQVRCYAESNLTSDGYYGTCTIYKVG